MNGVPFKVVKYAIDTTAQVMSRKRSEHVGHMIESVAAGAEELSKSVKEIADAMVRSTETASDEVSEVESADTSAHRLTTAAEAMSGIVELIGCIRVQINLLALNATIESARAGDAGRGFIVVAAEVKNLANQAKAATEKVESEVASFIGISGEVESALEDIKRSIIIVRDFVNSTSVAVDR